MAGQQRSLTAQEAADRLGIQVATLYAYVSRGLLRSQPGDGGTRARRYALEEVEALAASKEYRRQPERAAEAALVYGMPVLDSALTLIDRGKLYYRGRDVTELAQTHSFEEVAGLLWTGRLAAALFAQQPAPSTLPPQPTDPHSPIEHCQATLALAAPADLAAHQQTPEAVARTGARILALLARATTGEEQVEGSIALALQRAWCPRRPEAAALLSAALILCADHELNVSAFTARCVASAGSSPYAVVIAALSALQGHRHGGHTAHAAALLAAAAAEGVRPAIAGYLKGGDNVPGFGHPLYPDGDPRARCLLALLDEQCAPAPSLAVADGLRAAMHEMLGQWPTLDFALAALASAIGAPRHSPLIIFALGRSAGWIAHAGEQYALNQLIRPRARYTGPPPAAEDQRS
jgi:citrate synthase